MLRAIIIDDELTGINTLKLLIEKHTPDVRIIASSTDPHEGIKIINDYLPDILFLDVSMPKMNGFELLEKLSFRSFHLVFTTAHNEYALQAIKNKATDYLLKPIDIDELKTCIDAITTIPATKPVPNNSLKNIALSVKDGVIFVKPEEIIRLEAEGSYTMFILKNNQKHLVSKGLKEYENLLLTESFFRCHNSHIVNLYEVTKLVSNEGLFVRMSDNSLVEVSKRSKDLLISKLKGN